MILFVDDERYVIEPFLTALREKFGEEEVQYRNEPGRALEELAVEPLSKLPINVAIIDVMMDNAPEDWIDAGDEGESAGLVLADKLRDVYENPRIVFFTNHRNQFQLSRIKRYENSTYLDKRETSVPAFISLIESELGKGPISIRKTTQKEKS